MNLTQPQKDAFLKRGIVLFLFSFPLYVFFNNLVSFIYCLFVLKQINLHFYAFGTLCLNSEDLIKTSYIYMFLILVLIKLSLIILTLKLNKLFSTIFLSSFCLPDLTYPILSIIGNKNSSFDWLFFSSFINFYPSIKFTWAPIFVFFIYRFTIFDYLLWNK